MKQSRVFLCRVLPPHHPPNRLDAILLVALVVVAVGLVAVYIRDLRRQDDDQVRREVWDNPRVQQFSAEMEAFKKKLGALKEEDFIAIFGPKTDKPSRHFAEPCGQPIYMQGGFRPLGP